MDGLDISTRPEGPIAPRPKALPKATAHQRVVARQEESLAQPHSWQECAAVRRVKHWACTTCQK
eukprot:1123017-Amphidinium_carterae.1